MAAGLGRVRAGATGDLTLRPITGFWSGKVITAWADHGIDFSITVPRHKVIRTAIGGIDEADWVDIAYTAGGTAQVAEAAWAGWRLIVRRTRIDDDPTAARRSSTGATTRS